MPMITIDTLQAVADHANSLQAHCRCGHYATVDLAAAIARFGPDFSTVDGRERLLAALRCTKCGKRPYDLLMLPPKQWGGAS